MRERGAFSGAAFQVSRPPAFSIRYERVRTTVDGHRATVRVRMMLPDATHSTLERLPLGLDAKRLDALTPQERYAVSKRIQAMAATGRHPVMVGEGEK